MFTAFTPTTSSESYSAGETGKYVTFQGIHLNHGNSFDKNNGQFRTRKLYVSVIIGHIKKY